MATEWDALVLGAGLTGFAAACALAEKGKKVAVIFQDTGATSLSSGSWDLGPPSEGMPLARALESAAWREAYTPLLFEGEAPGKASTLQEDLKAVASAFKETLPMQLSFETPLLLPCLSGGLRHTYCAQEIQAAGNLSAANGKKFALVASRRWRFRADLLCRQWNDRLKKIGSSAEFRAVDLPLEMEGWDIPLSRVCADLAVSEGARVRFQEALGRFNDSVDGVVLPSIFPSFSFFEQVRAVAPFPVSEALASAEPTAGFRLWSAMQKILQDRQIPLFAIQRAQVQPVGGRIHEINVLCSDLEWKNLRAENFILASGRFLGGGLRSTFHRFEETLFALPLYTQNRSVLGQRRGTEGEKISFSGLKLDAGFRPLAEDGKPSFANLVAAGACVGGVDYARHSIGLGWFGVMGRRCVASLA